MKKLRMILSVAAIAAYATGCDDGTTSNPSTAARGDLNPPTGLMTLTGDTSVTLRWLGNNTEDDFKGYNVFYVAGDYTGTYGGTAWTASYPAGANLAKGSIPRCKDNNAIFETALKFPTSEADCEGDTATDTGATPAAGMALQDEPKLPFAKCDGKSDDNLSLPASEKVLGIQECKVTGLTNGTTYTFVVMAVMGSEFENLSWTSNFVTDTPAESIFSAEITIPQKNHLYLSHTDLLAAVTSGTLAADKWQTKTTCPAGVCSINGGGNVSAEGGLYFGRNGNVSATSKPARVFFSAPEKTTTATDSILYLYRGGQTYDPQNSSAVSTTIPDDMANAKEANYVNKRVVEVLGNEVIDLYVKNGDKWHFGKIVLDVPTLATATDEESDLKIKVTVIIQSASKVPHYFN
jgi:hypothetical protein